MTGIWINNKIILKGNLNKTRPCHKLGWCPYGQLVEEYPLEMKTSKFSCKLFGHNCPMYYQAEDLSEEKKQEAYIKIVTENKKKVK